MYCTELATAIAPSTEALRSVVDVQVEALRSVADVQVEVSICAGFAVIVFTAGRPLIQERYAPYTMPDDPQASHQPSRHRVQRPTALLIAAHGSTILRQRRRLVEIGFKVRTAYSLLDGYAEALQLLTAPRRTPPSLILLDVLGTEPGFPELPGSLLAAIFTRHMQAHEMRATWLVGLATQPETESETEALVGGCHHVVAAPLSDESLGMLYELVQRPAPVPSGDACAEYTRVFGVLQTVAGRVLQAVRAAHIDMWTAEDITLVLGWLTRFPTANQKAVREATIASVASAEYIKHLLRALGGPRAARGRLETIAEEWQARYPLHSEVLGLFLEGWERREIVRHFVEQGLYEDTRVYNCIKELPMRISEQFRIDQIGF